MSAGHSHHSPDYNRAFAIGVGLNLVFVVIEAGYGVLAGSLALIADAGHNLSDVFSLLLAWGASCLARKNATEKRTYGFRKGTVIASLISALVLLAALGGIAWEAIGRFEHPQAVAGPTVIAVAAIGVVINTLTALLFISGQKHDLNLRGAFLHMTADAAVSLGVVVSGVMIMTTGWLLIDPLVSLLIVAVVFIGTWSLLRESLNLAIDAVPEHIDMPGIRNYLTALKQVSQIHDLHVWPLSTTEVALTVHLVVDDDDLPGNFLATIQTELHDHFAIDHSTIQIERTDEAPCTSENGTCL
jgi:cobalt-zinc-cadmium efflux system protein